MTDNEPSSTSLMAPNSTNLIKELNDNDVLLGRGSGPSQFVGNRQFRSLVEDRRDAYLWAHKNKEKNEIAKELYDDIRALGGRFLKLIESMKHVDDVVREGVWFEVTEAVALEKCKQSLREKPGAPDGTSNGGFKVLAREAVLQGDIAGHFYRMGVGTAVNPTPNGGSAYGQPPPFPPNLIPVVPSMVAGSNVNPFLFQSALFALQQQASALQPIVANPVLLPTFNGSTQKVTNVLPDAHAAGDSTSQGLLQYMYHAMNTRAVAAYGSYMANSVLTSKLRYLQVLSAQATDSGVSTPDSMTATEVRCDQPPDGVAASQTKAVDYVDSFSNPSVSETSASPALSEGEVSDFLLFCVASGRPRFTEEQEEIERATMTDDEKAAALSDLFGQSCSLSTHVHKRARIDLDRNSVKFLLQQMRLELERIPEDEKRALTEAQIKCRAEEFSDARLERFLRCEGMNAKVRMDVNMCPFFKQTGSLFADLVLGIEQLGAKRFVNYWEGRREVFGPEKFVMRMTLSEALCDDLGAFEACFYRPLPNSDMSGRQILFIDPCRHNKKGEYTFESMIRTTWYVIEVLAQANTDIRSGVVAIVWHKDFTMWDYDDKLNERMAYFDMSCWPVKILASHICCPPWFMVKVVKPILYALIDKHARSRILFHNVPESHILEVLSNYGILKCMLPTMMGGTVRLDQTAWIANRRAAELGEI